MAPIGYLQNGRDKKSSNASFTACTVQSVEEASWGLAPLLLAGTILPNVLGSALAWRFLLRR
jgi:hypothetical protein